MNQIRVEVLLLISTIFMNINNLSPGYCAIAVAHMCGLASTPNLFDLSGEWLSSCQTFEGGFGGEPGCEAHVRHAQPICFVCFFCFVHEFYAIISRALSCFLRVAIRTVQLLL